MPYADRNKQREYQRQWIARRREAWMTGRTCADCGTTERLEVDHIDRATKIDHRLWSWTKDRMEAELVKCVVRCRSCHQKRSNRQWRAWHPLKHGTKRGYERGCRCSSCRKAKSDSNRRYS